MKKLMIVAAVAFSAIFAHAGYLYWQANPSYVQEGYNLAALFAGSGTGYSKVGDYKNVGNAGATDYYTVDVSSMTEMSFYIEYVNYSTSEKITTDAQTYLQLAGNHAIIGNELPMTMAQIWQGGTVYAAVPEPTSALLMLFGLSGLALKRRKV